MQGKFDFTQCDMISFVTKDLNLE